MKHTSRRRTTNTETIDTMDALRAELDGELAVLRRSGAADKLRRAFAAAPVKIAKAANAARRRKR